MTAKPQSPAYPPEFVETLAESADQTLLEWLTDNGAPEAATTLARCVSELHRYAAKAKQGDVEAWENKGIADLLGPITQAIADLGGVFTNGYTESNPREPVRWQLACASKEQVQS